jgi:MraZ protein
MDFLLGRYLYAVDHKGRVPVPPPLRRVLGEDRTLVLKEGLDGCLELYPQDRFQQVEEKVLQPWIGDEDVRAFQLAWHFNATTVTVDAQGRITIPPALIDRAGLGKEAVLLGQGSRFEIWNVDRLQAMVDEVQPRFRALAKKVFTPS